MYGALHVIQPTCDTTTLYSRAPPHTCSHHTVPPPPTNAPTTEVQYTAHQGHILSLCLLPPTPTPLGASCDSYGQLHIWSCATGHQLQCFGAPRRKSKGRGARHVVPEGTVDPVLRSPTSPPVGGAPSPSLTLSWGGSGSSGSGGLGMDDLPRGVCFSSCCAPGWHWASHVAAASLACSVQLLDVETGWVVSEHLTLPPGAALGTSWVRCMCSSVGEQWLAAGHSTGAACVVDMRMHGGVVARWRPHEVGVTALLAPGGHLLLTASKVRNQGGGFCWWGGLLRRWVRGRLRHQSNVSQHP